MEKTKKQLKEIIKKLEEENSRLSRLVLNNTSMMKNLGLIKKFKAVDLSGEYFSELIDKTNFYRQVEIYENDCKIVCFWRIFPDGNLVMLSKYYDFNSELKNIEATFYTAFNTTEMSYDEVMEHGRKTR